MKKAFLWALVYLILVFGLISCGSSGSAPLGVSSSSKAITVYSFSNPQAVSNINESDKTITVTVPYGTDVSGLVAIFTTTGAGVKVGGTVQVSGTTANDFTNPVVYTVTAADGSKANYTVTVTVALNSSKMITSFSILGVPGTVNESTKAITLSVPYGTDVTGLVAVFTTTGASVKIGGTVQVSGVTANDFSQSVSYTVTAADGSTASYTATVLAVTREFFVGNYYSDTISVFDSSSTGNVNPKRQFGSLTGLSDPRSFAYDAVHKEIFAANWETSSVTVYSASDSGNTVPIRTISGPNTGVSYPSSIAVDPVNNELFVANGTLITVYDRTDNGDVTFKRTISVPNTGYSWITAMSVDTVNNEIYVATDGNPVSIIVYSRTDNGNIAPKRTISGVNPGLSRPTGIAVDTVNSQIFVTSHDNSSIRIFGTSDTGDVAPVRTIENTSYFTLSGPTGIALDGVNNELLVAVDANYGTISVFNRTDSGSIMAKRTINGTNTGIYYATGIAVDTANNEIMTANSNNSIAVHSRTDSGNVAPKRTISGKSAGVLHPFGIASDRVNSEIFVVNRDEGYGSISVYGTAGIGNVVPKRVISGSNTNIYWPTGIAVDSTNNEIFITNTSTYVNGSVTVHRTSDSGNVAPVRTIGGANTALNNPAGIAVDTGHNEIFVVNGASSGTITVYGRTDNGNITPKRMISGSNTGLTWPVGIVLDTVHDEIFVVNGVYNGTVTVYSRTDIGDTTPKRTISGIWMPSGIAVDTVNNRIFVANGWDDSIFIYDRASSGNINPILVISGENTRLCNPIGVALW